MSSLRARREGQVDPAGKDKVRYLFLLSFSPLTYLYYLKKVWNVCVSSTFHLRDGTDPEALARRVLDEAAINIDLDNQTIGNDAGLKFIRDIRNCEDLHRHHYTTGDDAGYKLIRQMRDRGESSSPNGKDITVIFRTSILHEWSKRKGNHPHQNDERNLAAHGGNIAADVAVIKQSVSNDEEHATDWKACFSLYYGIPFDSVESYTSNIPYGLQFASNVRANVCTMNIWQTTGNKARRSNIIKNADTLIEKWLNDREIFKSPQPDIDKLLKDIDKDWSKVYNK